MPITWRSIIRRRLAWLLLQAFFLPRWLSARPACGSARLCIRFRSITRCASRKRSACWTSSAAGGWKSAWDEVRHRTNFADHGIDPDEAQARYFEAFIVLRQALAGRVDFEGKFYTFRNVPMEIAPVQRPHPPFWYGVGNPEGMKWAADNRINVVCNGPTSLVKAVMERYRSAWNAAGNGADALPFIAMNRFVVVSDTDKRAHEIGKRAYRLWHTKFFHLWNSRGSKPTYATYPDTFEELIQIGYAAIGNPKTVRAILCRQLDEAGNNYFVARFAFGDMTLDETKRSVRLFANEVMPSLSSGPFDGELTANSEQAGIQKG